MRFIWLIFFLSTLSFSAFASNDDLLKEIISRAHETGSDSLVIVQDHKLVYSNFFGGTDRVRNVQSITKSVAAIAVGILLQEGKIHSLDIPMSHWLPSWRFDAVKSKITLRMIMNHTSGLPHGEPDFFENPDIIAAALATPLENKPGEVFEYSNIGATLVQPVIETVAAMPVDDFIEKKIFAPLGIGARPWEADEHNHTRTSGGLHLSTGDLLILGEMMLAHGRHNGNEILSGRCEDYLLAKSQPYAEYGLFWWRKYDLFYAQGWGGQFLVIDFEKNLIAIRTRDPRTIDRNKLEDQYYRDFVELVSRWE